MVCVGVSHYRGINQDLSQGRRAQSLEHPWNDTGPNNIKHTDTLSSCAGDTLDRVMFIVCYLLYVYNGKRSITDSFLHTTVSVT